MCKDRSPFRNVFTIQQRQQPITNIWGQFLYTISLHKYKILLLVQKTIYDNKAVKRRRRLDSKHFWTPRPLFGPDG